MIPIANQLPYQVSEIGKKFFRLHVYLITLQFVSILYFSISYHALVKHKHFTIVLIEMRKKASVQ
jgi:hypothetical protein